MIRLNIHEAKTRLSEYLSRVEAGETILLCRRNVPIAEIRPVRMSVTKPRPIGLYDGEMDLPEAFFDPLPAEILRTFDGHGDE